MEEYDREDLDAAVVAMGVSLRCTASSWETKRIPKTPSYGPKGFNQCTFSVKHRGDHKDEFGQVFRLSSEGVATIVRVEEMGPPSLSDAMNGILDVPKSRIEQEEQDAEEERLRGTRFSETREYPGMNGFPLTQLQDPEEPDSPVRRLARIVGLHWASENNAFGGPLRQQCVECEKDYPCETVQIAMGLMR